MSIGWVGSDKFDQENYRVTGSVQVNLIRVEFWIEHYRVFLSFRSFRAGSGLRFLVAQIISGFGSFKSGSGQISGHLISGSLGFWVISGQAGPGRVLFL
jgi:hypothetical protein